MTIYGFITEYQTVYYLREHYIQWVLKTNIQLLI